MKKFASSKLALNIETLRDLTPDEAVAINGGVMMTVAQPVSSVMPTGPVVQPTSSVRPTGPGGTVVTAPTPVHHKKHHHHHHHH